MEFELPDGTVETEGYKVELDFEEILALVTYTLEYMKDSEAMKDYLVFSILEPMEKMAETGAIPGEELPGPEELEEMTEMVYQEFQNVMQQAIDYLNNVSPALLRSQFGLDLSVTEQYHLDDEGFIRKTISSYFLG